MCVSTAETDDLSVEARRSRARRIRGQENDDDERRAMRGGPGEVAGGKAPASTEE